MAFQGVCFNHSKRLLFPSYSLPSIKKTIIIIVKSVCGEENPRVSFRHLLGYRFVINSKLWRFTEGVETFRDWNIYPEDPQCFSLSLSTTERTLYA